MTCQVALRGKQDVLGVFGMNTLILNQDKTMVIEIFGCKQSARK